MQALFVDQAPIDTVAKANRLSKEEIGRIIIGVLERRDFLS